MSDRYFHAGPLVAGEMWLDDAEAHHLLHVMRGRPGEQIELFDGRGHCAAAVIRETQKRRVLLDVSPPVRPVAAWSLPQEVVLATAVPKGDRFRWLIEKATEVGVTRLIPLDTARSVVNPRESKLDKQQQYVIEACKQSGRNVLLEISSLQSLTNFLESRQPEATLVVGSPAGSAATPREFSSRLSQNTGPVVIVVGPEGGLTDAELVQLDQAGAIPLAVSPHILRTETAGLMLAGAVIAGLLHKSSDALA